MDDIETLLEEILREYELPWSGIHGLSHWGRVLENGLRLAEVTGANPDVVTLFALFHDARRVNEGSDPGHGRRGADLAASLRGVLFDLGDEDFELLYTACDLHADGLTDGDVTVQTCWDADRLDLARVGISPHPDLLCTVAARDHGLLAWANERAETVFVPESVRGLWDAMPDRR